MKKIDKKEKRKIFFIYIKYILFCLRFKMSAEYLADKILNNHTFPKACKYNINNDKKILEEWIDSNSSLVNSYNDRHNKYPSSYKEVDECLYNDFIKTKHYYFINKFERLFEETIDKYNWYRSDEDCLFWRDLLFSYYEKTKFMEYLCNHLVGIDIDRLKDCFDEDCMCNFIMLIYKEMYGGLIKNKKKLFGLF